MSRRLLVNTPPAFSAYGHGQATVASFPAPTLLISPPGYEHLRPGCIVRHPKFGLGKVIELSQPWPDTRAKIEFSQCGTKKIVLAMTHLELASEY